MKKIVSLLLVMCLTICTVNVSFAADSKGVDKAKLAADDLYSLGLFNGTGKDANGAPIYSLEKSATRAEAITMLVNLLGKSDEAKQGTWDTPFTDVPAWAEPFVGYAYTNGLTSGTSATTFGSSATVTATQYLTFVLKALGYEVGTDFQWDKAWELTDKLGITNGEYNEKNNTDFIRGDVVIVSDNAIYTNTNGEEDTLLSSICDGEIELDWYEPNSELPFGSKEVNALLLSLEPDWCNISGYSRVGTGYDPGVQYRCGDFDLDKFDLIKGELDKLVLSKGVSSWTYGNYKQDSVDVKIEVDMDRDDNDVIYIKYYLHGDGITVAYQYNVRNPYLVTKNGTVQPPELIGVKADSTKYVDNIYIGYDEINRYMLRQDEGFAKLSNNDSNWVWYGCQLWGLDVFNHLVKQFNEATNMNRGSEIHDIPDDHNGVHVEMSRGNLGYIYMQKISVTLSTDDDNITYSWYTFSFE